MRQMVIALHSSDSLRHTLATWTIHWKLLSEVQRAADWLQMVGYHLPIVLLYSCHIFNPIIISPNFNENKLLWLIV